MAMGYMLDETKRDLLSYAKLLPEIEVNGKTTRSYEDYSINVLADEYCKAKDNNDEVNKNIYFSALALRFWYVINKIYQQVSFYGYDYLDCFNRLYYCIEVACKYRAWQDPTKHTNAQACINMAIRDRGAAMMAYEAKLQKNGPTNVSSLDDNLDDDSNATKGDLLADDSYEQRKSEERVFDLVQTLIENGKVVEAIIADNIAFKNVFRTNRTVTKDSENKKQVKETTEFWPFQLVKELNDLDEEYYNYFYNTYSITFDKLKSAQHALNIANNQKKYRYIDAAKLTMKSYMSN